MNFCTKCASYYQQPGTCNCFAPPKVQPYSPETFPNVSPPWIQPNTAPFYPFGYPGTWIVYSDCSNIDLTKRETQTLPDGTQFTLTAGTAS